MNDLNKKAMKYPKVSHHFRKVEDNCDNAPVPNWNYQPRIPTNDKPLQRLIRKQVKPFTPELVEKISISEPIANMRRIIDFSLASLRESDKRYHCQIMANLCQRLGVYWNCTNYISAEALYHLYEHYSWQCPVTKIRHSFKTPLSLEFLVRIWQGGSLTISNVIPRYTGDAPGEWTFTYQPTLFELRKSA